jgi:hypothetical protein
MTTPDAFFTRKREFRLSLARDLRMCRVDLAFAPVCVLMGFFLFRTAGQYRIYDVVTPFWIAAAAAATIAFYVSFHEMRGLTSRFYRNLPRDRAAAWDARVLFLLGLVVFLEGVAFLGIFFGLGGEGLVDYHRIHPQWVVLPVYAVAVVLWGLVKPRTLPSWFRMVGLLALGALPFVWLIVELRRPVRTLVPGDYLPLRGIPLGVELLAAAVLLGLTVYLLIHARRAWLHPESGE